MPAESKSAAPISKAKLAANRNNAKKSTGPKTPEGKARSAMNALKHGLLAQSVVLPDDDEESLDELEAMRSQLVEELAPANLMETLLVERIVASYWRLRRLYRYEVQTIVDARMIQHESYTDQGGDEQGEPPPVPAQLPAGYDFERLIRYEAGIDRTLHRLAIDLIKARSLRPNPPEPQPNLSANSWDLDSSSPSPRQSLPAVAGVPASAASTRSPLPDSRSPIPEPRFPNSVEEARQMLADAFTAAGVLLPDSLAATLDSHSPSPDLLPASRNPLPASRFPAPASSPSPQSPAPHHTGERRPSSQNDETNPRPATAPGPTPSVTPVKPVTCRPICNLGPTPTGAVPSESNPSQQRRPQITEICADG